MNKIKKLLGLKKELYYLEMLNGNNKYAEKLRLLDELLTEIENIDESIEDYQDMIGNLK